MMECWNIAKGKSHDKMIRALNDLGVLGKMNLQILETVNYDMSLLDRAVQLSKEMAKLLKIMKYMEVAI